MHELVHRLYYFTPYYRLFMPLLLCSTFIEWIFLSLSCMYVINSGKLVKSRVSKEFFLFCNFSNSLFNKLLCSLFSPFFGSSFPFAKVTLGLVPFPWLLFGSANLYCAQSHLRHGPLNAHRAPLGRYGGPSLYQPRGRTITPRRTPDKAKRPR